MIVGYVSCHTSTHTQNKSIHKTIINSNLQTTNKQAINDDGRMYVCALLFEQSVSGCVGCLFLLLRFLFVRWLRCALLAQRVFSVCRVE